MLRAMGALIAATLCSASLALLFRRGAGRGMDRLAVTMANYATASIAAALLWAIGSRGAPDAGLTPAAVLIAVPGGVLYFLGFLLYQRAVARHGTGVAGMYGKLGVLVPMAASMIVWREFPSAGGAAGMMLAVAAIVVSQSGAPVSRSPGRQPATAAGAAPGSGVRAGSLAGGGPVHPLLIAQLLVMGLAEFTNKLFERYGTLAARPAFLFLLFTIALVSAAGALAASRARPRWGEVGLGVAVGIPNLLSSWFLIAALETVPAAVAFPLFSAGATALITIGARLLFGERPTPRQRLAITLTVVALVLLNVPRKWY